MTNSVNKFNLYFIKVREGWYRGNVDHMPIGFEYYEDDGKLFSIVGYKGEKHRANISYEEFNKLGVRKQKEYLYPKHQNGIVLTFKPKRKEKSENK